MYYKNHECKCLRCGHKWRARTGKMPRWCPNCNSPYWNKPRSKGKKK